MNEGKSIDELEKSLYDRNTPEIRTRRKLRFGNKTFDIRRDWGDKKGSEEETPLNRNYEDHHMSFASKLLIGSFIFCALALGIGAYIFFKGNNFISADNIDIVVSGPVSVPGGSPVSFDINVFNKNNVDLELADLTVEYPAGTTDPKDPTKELTTFREMIGDIPSQGSGSKKVSAIIFGEENSEKQILVSVSYKIKNSTSQFTKQRTYDLLINSSPISLTASSYKEISSGQEFEMKVDVTSNSSEVLKNVLVSALYPIGYSYVSSSVDVLPDKSTWKLGDIPPQSKRQIIIKGRLEGSNEDIRVFKFKVGAPSTKNPNVIGTEYMIISQEVSISKPFVDLKIAVDGSESPTYSVASSFDRSKNVEIYWYNNLPNSLSNMSIVAKLEGNSYDKSLINPSEGYYRSSTNEIIWDTRTNPDFVSVGSGDSGKVSFGVTPANFSSETRLITNPKILITASVSGKRTQEINVPSAVIGAKTKEIRVSALPILNTRVVRDIGPFANTGPIPPKAEKASTYTVIWTVDSTVNSLSNVYISAILPPYVKWLNKVSPDTENIDFSSTTGAVTWKVGSVSAFSQNSGRTRQVAFQISFEPSAIQVGTSQILVEDTALEAQDDFTGEKLSAKSNFLTTVFSTDPSYRDTMGAVVQ